MNRFNDIKVIIGGRFDYIRYSYDNLITSNDITYFDNDSPLLFSPNLSDKLKYSVYDLIEDNTTFLRVRKNWREYFPIDKLKKNDKILFIIYEMNLMSTDINSISIIKEHFPNSKFVLFFTNTIGSVRPEVTDLILKNRNVYDLIFSFDRFDAKKNGFLHLHGGLFPYSSHYLANGMPETEYSSDIFFCGKDKGRLAALISMVNTLTSKGVKCKFLVCNPDINNIIHNVPNNVFITKDLIPYSEVIKYIANTKCLFEYSTSTTPTLRYSEAIAYGKKLISNAQHLKYDELYNNKQFLIYRDLQSTNILNFINTPIRENEKVDPLSISPHKFIESLINNLF